MLMQQRNVRVLMPAHRGGTSRRMKIFAGKRFLDRIMGSLYTASLVITEHDCVL
jgi:hypothetical protein